MSTTTKRINFETAEEFVNAFNAGRKFVVIHTEGLTVPLNVNKVALSSEGKSGFALHVGAAKSYYTHFRLDGTHPWLRKEIHEVVEVLRPGVDILKSLSAGETLYCPKTREVVDGVVHHPVEGFLVYLWKTDENGRRVQSADLNKVVRVSDNYRVDGTHRHDPARDLVKGEVPVVKKTYVTVVGRNTKFGTIGTVTYQVNGPKSVPKVGDRVQQGELYAAIGAMPGTVIHVCTFEA